MSADVPVQQNILHEKRYTKLNPLLWQRVVKEFRLAVGHAVTTTAAKKGGDNLGYSGHKHLKGDKVVAFCDRDCNIIAPFICAPGNRNESPLLRGALPRLTGMARAIGADLQGSTVSPYGVYDCRANRKAIFNRGMTPNIPENPRGRKTPRRGRKQPFDPAIFEERFRTIERVFSWEDKFRRHLLRFERISDLPDIDLRIGFVRPLCPKPASKLNRLLVKQSLKQSLNNRENVVLYNDARPVLHRFQAIRSA